MVWLLALNRWYLRSAYSCLYMSSRRRLTPRAKTVYSWSPSHEPDGMLGNLRESAEMQVEDQKCYINATHLDVAAS